MKGKTVLRKTTVFMLVLVFSLVFAQMIPGNGITPVIQAKSIKKTIKKAKKAFTGKMDAIADESDDGVEYQFIDITGDKVPEVLAKYIKRNKRHGNLDVYTYKNGKIKRLLHIRNDNLKKIYFYRKTKTLVIYDSYHDYNDCAFYKYSKRKIHLIAKKCVNSANGGSVWYEKQNGHRISKKKFNRIVKRLKTGSRKNLRKGYWYGTSSETEY